VDIGETDGPVGRDEFVAEHGEEGGRVAVSELVAGGPMLVRRDEVDDG